MNKKIIDRMKFLYATFFGIIITIAVYIGRFVYFSNGYTEKNMGNVVYDISASGVILFFFLSVILALIFFYALSYCKLPIEYKYKYRYSLKVCIILGMVIWAILAVSFFFALYALFPGNLSYDFSTQAYYYFEVQPFTKHHPPLHSFLIFEAIKYGTLKGVYAETVNAIIQIILFSFSIACCFVVFLRLNLHWHILLAALLYYCLNPAFKIFSVTTTKDTLFGGFFLLLTVMIMYLCNNTELALKSVLFWLAFFVVALLCCLLRNNGIYVIVLSTPFICSCLKPYWKRLVILFVIPILSFFLIDKVIYSCVFNIGEGSSAEKLCVPIQQLAAVEYCYGEKLTEEDRTFLTDYFSIESLSDSYNPRFADPAKSLFNADLYDDNKVSFWRGWLKMGLEYPGCFLESFLTLNIPYWYLGANTLDAYSNVQYIEIDDMNRMDRMSYNIQSLSLYKKFASYELMEEHAFLKPFFSITTPFWLLLMSLFVLLVKRQRRMIPVLCPSIFLWITLIAGPVSNFRYVFPIVLIYPCLYMVVFNSIGKQNEDL